MAVNSLLLAKKKRTLVITPIPLLSSIVAINPPVTHRASLVPGERMIPGYSDGDTELAPPWKCEGEKKVRRRSVPAQRPPSNLQDQKSKSRDLPASASPRIR